MAWKLLHLLGGVPTAQEAVTVSGGAPDEGKIAALDSTGKFDSSFIPVSGGSANKVTAQVDFGFASGNEGDIAKVTVAASWASATSGIICAPLATATADHDPDDYAIEGITSYVTNIVDGVGFDIIVAAPHGTWGRYNMQAIGV